MYIAGIFASVAFSNLLCLNSVKCCEKPLLTELLWEAGFLSTVQELTSHLMEFMLLMDFHL